MENEILLLNKIGLTDAEAKVYLTLLQHGNLSGYEASKLAGVPRSKIYNLLESLVNKGFILYTQYESNNKYSAIPMAEVADKVKHQTDDVLTSLTEKLSVLPERTNMDYIWHIRSNDNVFAKCRDIIKKTEHELLLQVWKEDYPYIKEELIYLEKYGARIGIVFFNMTEEDDLPFKNYCLHKMEEEKKAEMGGRWITLVSDNKEVVFGQIINDTVSEVIWTKSRPMIVLAAEMVRHDLYFYKSAKLFQDDMEKEFGKDIKGIRDIF
jgi:sugar-specific transcriptional regulator TrmB